MKKITIYGHGSEDEFGLRLLSGNPAETDAFDTLMQVLRHGAKVRNDILIWDEDTWDDFVWG